MSAKGVALITGAGQGIGRAIALRLADDGWDVVVNDIETNSQRLNGLREELEGKGRAVSTFVGDVSQEEAVKELIAHAVNAHGGLDVMVANAGIAGTPQAGFAGATVEEFDRIMSVNARGTFLCYKHAGLQMIKQGRGGRIIGASSVAGKKAMQTQVSYSASKFAVRGLTQAAAQEFGPHSITVNAYAPGAIDTPLLTGGPNASRADAIRDHFKNLSPLKQVGAPEDIANLVSFLASKESQFITGQSISINGGIFFD